LFQVHFYSKNFVKKFKIDRPNFIKAYANFLLQIIFSLLKLIFYKVFLKIIIIRIISLNSFEIWTKYFALELNCAFFKENFVKYAQIQYVMDHHLVFKVNVSENSYEFILNESWELRQNPLVINRRRVLFYDRFSFIFILILRWRTKLLFLNYFLILNFYDLRIDDI